MAHPRPDNRANQLHHSSSATTCWTQDEIAEKTGWKQQDRARIAAGETPPPSPAYPPRRVLAGLPGTATVVGRGAALGGVLVVAPRVVGVSTRRAGRPTPRPEK